MYSKWIKRILDFIIAMILLVLCSPIFLVLFILVRFYLGSPVIYRQIRPGFNERPFCLFKFRTMQNHYDKQGKLLHDSERLTSFGRILRSTSLDELPELINVLKGEMSLVGPRPLLMDYLPYYSKEQRERHHVKPGMTGYAQINGRNSLSWKNKFEFDIWYVKNCSFLLDCKIIFLTIVKIIKRDGIHAFGQATMTRFDHESQQNSTETLN